MAEEVKGLTVVFEKNIRLENIESLINAIYHLRGVAEVTPVLTNSGDYIAQQQLKYDIRKKFHQFINETL